ncbi:MAG TPA: winged helix-turn-helix domain-containing protein [Dokdonella sp.]|uniref:winged helix-turn-helix domain-containing protein n=1 Tax=Dokdonella sp. TaxID=2291710 RepID=UPI002D7F01D6|nr:winged helix-turn-helix domain-containing protein [Dokdonella sp.]HET9034069.1 winged helix-turn-helix domain-containing protein [Dokdonella sp.]
MSDPLSNSFQLGEWQIHVGENCIVRGEERVTLEPRVMDLLVFLSQHPEQTLGKDEILQSVWGSLHHSDSVIARAISLLRQHLQDDARNPAYIRTVPSRGYRLIAPVTPISDERLIAPEDLIEKSPEQGDDVSADRHDEPASATTLPLAGSSKHHWIAAAMLALVVISATALWSRQGEDKPQAGAQPAALARLNVIAIAPLADRDVPDDHRYLIHDVHEAVASALLKRGKHRVLMLPEPKGDEAEGGTADYLALARKSGADAVLTGSAVEKRSRIDVELRLVVATTRELLWTITLEEDPGSEQAFRDGIVASVMSSLGAALEAPAGKAAQDYPADPRAYRLQAQARWFVQRRSVEGVRKAHQLFKQAVEQDPAYADAFSGLALSFIHQIQYNGMPAESAYAQAMAAAERALELDPDHSEAIAAKAEVLALRDWNFEAAIGLLQRALALDPGNIAARQHLAEMQTVTRDYDAAVENINRALAIKPYSALLLGVKTLILTHAERYDDALDAYRQAQLLAPDFTWHTLYGSFALARSGKPIEAALLRAKHHSFLAKLDASEQQALQHAIETEGPAALWRAVADHAQPYRQIGLPLYRFFDFEQLAARGRDDEALDLLEDILKARGEVFVVL